MAEARQFAVNAAMPVEDVAALLSVSAKTVRNWINQRALPFSDGGRGRVLAWPATLEWYVQMRIAKQLEHSGNSTPDEYGETLDHAETRKTVADADLKELRLAQLRGQLVPADEVGRNVGRVATAIKTKLDGLPNSLALRLVGKSDRIEVQQILRDAIFRIKLELATVGSVADPVSVSDANEDE